MVDVPCNTVTGIDSISPRPAQESFLEKRPRVAWMTLSCTTRRTQTISVEIKVLSNILNVFLWLFEQDWCETILEQMWGSTSLGRGGAFSDLKEQFHSGRPTGCQWSGLAAGTLSSKSWYFVCSHRRWSDLLCSRRCLHYHPHQTLEKETLQYTSQLVKTVMKDAHCRLNQEEQRALDLASEGERERARTMVSRLHVELGHPEPQGMIDSLRRKHAHRLIIATAKKFSCSACEESQRRRLRPIVARVLQEPGTCHQVDRSRRLDHNGSLLMDVQATDVF